MTTTGITSGNNNVNLRTGTSLTINEQLNAGPTGDIRIVAGTTVGQGASGVITGDELGIIAATSVVLTAAANDVNTLAVGSTVLTLVEFRDADDLIVGTVAAGGGCGFTNTIGITSTGGNVNLGVGTSLTVNSALNAGTGDIRIVAGTVGQGASGAITGDELGIRATGAVALAGATNDVNTLAVATTGLVEFLDGDNLTIGTVAAGGTAGFTPAVVGVVSGSSDINLSTGGTLAINSPLTAGTADIRIVSSTNVTQQLTGVITANELGIRAGTTVFLCPALNDVDTLAISANGLIEFRDVDDLAIGSVAAGGSANINFTGVTGVSSGGASDINLRSASLNITQPLNAGTGDIRIVVSGIISQAAAGVITADELGIQAGGSVNLAVTASDVNTLAVSTTGLVEFDDSDNLTVGTVIAGGNCGFTGATGISSFGGNVNLRTGSSLQVSSPINAGGGDVRIVAGTSVNQSSGGIVSANNLGITATSFVTLCAAINDVNTLAVSTTGLIEFRDGDDLIIGAVSAGGNAGFGGATGLTSNGGDINLRTGTSLAINAATNAGAGDIRIVAGSTVNQNASGNLTANELGIQAGGAVTLVAATNDVDNLAVTTTGLIEFKDSDDLTIALVIAGGNCGFTGANGLSSGNQNINLQTGTSLAVNAPVNAGSAGDVRIVAGTAVSQTAAGVVTADELGVRAGGVINLGVANNDANIFAATSPAGISYRDVDDLIVGAVISGGNAGFTPAVVGVTSTTAGDISILTVDAATAGQNLTIQGVPVTAANGNVTLQAGDNFTLTAAATITATAVSIFADFNNADAGIGATVDIQGVITNTAASVIQGHNDNDIFHLVRQGHRGHHGRRPGRRRHVQRGAAGTIDQILGQFNLVGGAGTNDQATINDQSDADVNTYLITSTTVDRNGGLVEVGYNTLERLTLNAGTAANTVNVQGTALGTPTFVNTQAGDDIINVSSDAPTNNGHLNDVQGALTVDVGGGQGNRLIVSDFGGAANTNAVITSSTISGMAPALITYGSSAGQFTNGAMRDGISIRGSDTGDDVFLIASTRAVTTTQVEGHGGADTFHVGSTPAADFGDLDTITGELSVIGGAPAVAGSLDCDADPTGTRDFLYLNDRGNFNPNNYHVNTSVENAVVSSPDTVRIFAGVFFDTTMEYVRLDGTDLGNVFDVRPSVDTQFYIDGNLPDPGECGPDGIDYLRLDLTGTTGRKLNSSGLGRGHWSFTSGHRHVCFESIEKFNHVDKLAVANAKGAPVVRVYDAETLEFQFEVRPYEAHFKGGVRVAVADMNLDGIPDIITAPGAGRNPTVKIINGAADENGNYPKNTLTEFSAFSNTNKKGVFVTTGNVDDDGCTDLIVSADAGWVPQVRVFDGHGILHSSTRTLMREFLAFANSFRGGVRVASGDLDGDGLDEIIAATGPGKSDVRVFNGGDFRLIKNFQPLGSQHKKGLFVAVGDFDGNGVRDLIAASDSGAISTVAVFDGEEVLAPGTPQSYNRFLAFPNNVRSGVRLAVKPRGTVDPGLVEHVDLFMATGSSAGAVGRKVRKATFNGEGLNPTVVDAIFQNSTYDGIYLG